MRATLLGFFTPILLALAAPATAQAPAHFQLGVTRLNTFSYVYNPKSTALPAPIIILLHGAGGNARSFLDQFKRDADARGNILLSIQSSGRTWQQRAPTDGAADVASIETAISDLATLAPTDRRRMTVLGFSDGASFALSVGMARPDLFRTIIAFSPGYAFAPAKPDLGQKIFIAHSRRDPILPASNVRDMIKGLETAGFSPEVHWFNGGHEIDPDLKKAALDFALKP